MPDGTMTGTGSKDDPYIIMDGYDFNALRNIESSSTDYKYIELGMDISLSVYANFTPIPEKYFNIDGKGFSITDIYISRVANYMGLFERLYSNDFIKNIKIEGEIVIPYNVNYSVVACGALCAQLSLSADAVMFRVEAFFSIVFSTPYNIAVGGLAGGIEISGRGSKSVSECAFKGAFDLSSTSSGSTYQILIGGLFAQTYNNDKNDEDWFTIERCRTDIRYRVDNRLNMRMGGILGQMTNGSMGSTTSSTSVSFSLMIRECVAHTVMQFTHTSAVTTNTHRVCGIACYPGEYRSQVTTVEKCVAFIDILWSHQFPLSAFRMSGLLHGGTASGQKFTIDQGYAVMRMINPEGIPWDGVTENIGSVTYLPSASPTVNVTGAFFDKQVFAEYYDGVFTETHGITMAELKSIGYLKQKSWEFDE